MDNLGRGKRGRGRWREEQGGGQLGQLGREVFFMGFCVFTACTRPLSTQKFFGFFFPPACIFNSLTNERKVGATEREKTDFRSRRMLTTALEGKNKKKVERKWREKPSELQRHSRTAAGRETLKGGVYWWERETQRVSSVRVISSC